MLAITPENTHEIHPDFIIAFSSLLPEAKQIGAGGSACIYQSKYLQSPVAIKEFPASKSDELISEAVVMLQLKHPNIIQCYGICLEDGYRLVMELMPDGSLNDLLQNQKNIEWSDFFVIAMDIATGLAYLHEQNIIHCDLKSHNILINNNRAKIGDFGLAKNKTESSSGVLGSTRWMAPELLKDVDSTNTFESDIYSMAMIFWEMLTHEIPFKSLTVLGVINAVGKGQKEVIPANCPSFMDRIINECWETDPQLRPKARKITQEISVWCSLFPAESLPSTSPPPQGFLEKLRSHIHLLN